MNPLRIEIVSDSVNTFSGKRKSDGQPYTMRKQEAYLHKGKAYPERFELTLGKDDSGNDLPAYKPGFYTVTPDSFEIDQYHALGFAYAIKLVAEVAEAPKAKVV